MNDELIIKIVIVGECGVGKSNLLLRFKDDTFDDRLVSTIATEFYSIPTQYEQYNARIQFWDTAGQEKYRSLVPSFLHQCDGVVLVFDLTSKVSFSKLEEWMELLKDKVSEDTRILVIGNKSDLISKREVSEEEAKQLAEQWNVFYWETSAKDNSNGNVQKAFEEISQCCLNDKLDKIKNERSSIGSEYTDRQRGSIRNIRLSQSTPTKHCC